MLQITQFTNTCKRQDAVFLDVRHRICYQLNRVMQETKTVLDAGRASFEMASVSVRSVIAIHPAISIMMRISNGAGAVA